MILFSLFVLKEVAAWRMALKPTDIHTQQRTWEKYSKHTGLTASIAFLIDSAPETEHVNVRLAEEILHNFRVTVEILVHVDTLELGSKRFQLCPYRLEEIRETMRALQRKH